MKKLLMKFAAAAAAFCMAVSAFPQIKFVYAGEAEELLIDYSCGDRTFFHSDYLSDKGNKYENLTEYENGNVITLNRCEQRFNPNRTDNSIHLSKTNSLACRFDVAVGGNEYKYFLIRSNVILTGGNAKTELARIESENGFGAPLLEISADGALCSDGNFLGKAPESFSFALNIDFLNFEYDVYINGEKKLSNVKFSSDIKDLSVARFQICSGSGNASLSFGELEITGMRKEYKGDELNYSSIFPSDEPIKEYLKDKVAFQAYSGNISADGIKSKLQTKPFYDEENDEIYLFADAIKQAYGLDLQDLNGVLSGGGLVFRADESAVSAYGKTLNFDVAPRLVNKKVCVPLRELCKRVLKLNYFADGKGLFITSDKEIQLKADEEKYEYNGEDNRSGIWGNIRSINRYMMFERPDADEIYSIYQNACGNAEYPVIVADNAAFDALKQRYKTDSEYKSFCDYIISKANSMLQASPMDYKIPDGQRLSGSGADIRSKMEHFGFAYQLTGEQKYADAAWRFFEKYGSYPDWNPSHIIDTGEICVAYAMGYSWMRSGFNEEQRNYIYNTVKKYGMEPIRLAYYGRLGGGVQYADRSDVFAAWSSNFNGIVNSGAICTALAFMEFDGGFCSDLAEKAIRSIEYTFVGFADDGGWIEGTGYWDYMFEQLKQGISALFSVLGTDFGLTECRGFNKTAEWRAGMWTYQGNNNFHDSGNGRSYSSALSFLGKLFNKPSYYAMRNMQLEYTKNSVAEPYDAIWYCRDYAGREDELSQCFYSKGTESFVMRSPYSNQGSYTYLSAHGGAVSCYHSHNDAGSFILDMRGLRWACDLGGEDYNTQRDYADGEYASYRKRAEAHNVMVINPNTSSKDGGQSDGAFVPLLSFKSGDEGLTAVYDMTDAYKEYAENYKRSFYMNKEKTGITVSDRLELKSKSELNWFMTTDANVVSYDESMIVLKKLNTYMYLKYKTNAADCEVSVTDCTPLLGAPVLKGQNPNTGYKRLRIKMTAEAETYISVSMSTDDSYEKFFGFDIPDSEYNFEGAEKNDLSTVKDVISQKSASARHMPPILNYDVQNGVFGRSAKDRSLHLWNSEEYSDYPDPYQFVEFPLSSKGKMKTGDAEKLSFYMAYDGGKAGKYINAFIHTEDLPEGDRKANTALLRLEPDASLYIWNKKVENFVPKRGRWYKISVVNVCGDISGGIDNKFYLYIDNRLVMNGTFLPEWRGNAKQSFKGLEKVWIGQQLQTGNKSEQGGYEHSGLYLDDLKIFSYGKNDLPFYVPLELSHSDYKINSGISFKNTYDFYVSPEKNIGDIITGLSANAKITFRDAEGNELNEMSSSAGGAYMEAACEGSPPLYFRLICESETQYSFCDEDIPLDKSSLPDKLQTNLSPFSRVSYPSGIAGRSSDDVSLSLSTEGYDGSGSGCSQYVQYTYSDIKDKNMPVYTDVSFCLKELPKGSELEIHLIYNGGDGKSKWFRYAKINDSGELEDLSGNVVCKLEKNRWYKAEFCFYQYNQKADLIINGSYVIRDMDFSCDAGYKSLQRIKINQTVPSAEKAEFLADDITVYMGAQRFCPEYDELKLNLSSGGAFVDNDNAVIYAEPGSRLSEQVDDRQNTGLYKNDLLGELNGGCLEDGNVAVLRESGMFKYFKVSADFGKIYNSLIYNVKSFAAQRSGSAVNVKYTIGSRKHNSPIAIILAKYDNSGKLKDVQTKNYMLYGTSAPSGNMQTEREFSRTVKFTSPAESGTYLKVFLFNDINRIVPIYASPVIN